MKRVGGLFLCFFFLLYIINCSCLLLVTINLMLQDVTLPEVKIGDIDASTKKLLIWSYKLQNYWKASPYHLEERTSKKRQRMHIARFSDKKGNDFTRDSLSQVLMFKEFPQELVQGASKQTSRRKKFRWNPESGLMIFHLTFFLSWGISYWLSANVNVF
uniref:Uncharacterized protein n=1 Tax=Cajanus cajan TaxID=3821 RepID=A0A151S3I3_CAJCA|nr:hypothetical protein KK1_028955 [Cajanus cajan]